MVSRAAGMIMPVRGSASILVSRKCSGKDLKYIHASGPVVIWQAIDNAAESHIFLTAFIAGMSEDGFPGQNDLSRGYIKAIPAIAA